MTLEILSQRLVDGKLSEPPQGRTNKMTDHLSNQCAFQIAVGSQKNSSNPPLVAISCPAFFPFSCGMNPV
eukprot:3787035-Amphidinium_carterae.1